MPLLGLVALLAGCSALVPAGAQGRAPADPDALMRPDLIVAEPLSVRRGDMLSLTFPTETFRGVHFVLERQAGESWSHEFDLVSDGPGPEWQPRWSHAGAEGFAVEDIGVGGPGPDRVVIPDAAAPGQWRICTGNAAENICTTIEIVDP